MNYSRRGKNKRVTIGKKIIICDYKWIYIKMYEKNIKSRHVTNKK